MRARDKFIVALLIAVVAVATVAAFVSANTASGAPPAFGGSYTEGVASAGPPRTFDPLFASTQAERDVSALVFTGLTRFDQRGLVVRDLATDFSSSEDGKTWTFTIRSDARWHDGEPVVAADVVYTVGVAQDESYHGPYAGTFAGAKVEALDDRTVRFVLPDVFAPFLEASTIPLLPSHLLRDVPAVQLERDPFSVRPVGTGPFRFDSRDESRVTLVRNDNFYRVAPQRTRPYLDKVVLRLFPDTNAAVQALARGELQGLGGISADDADRVRGARDISTNYFPSDEATVLFFNLAPDHATFRDRSVRQAIAMAINRPRLVQLIAGGHASITDQPALPSSWAYSRDLPRRPFAPDDARTILDAAGWIDHDGDGVRDKGGVALRFGLVTNDDPPRVATVQQIAHDLDAIGISAQVEVVSFNQLVDTRARERTFDAMVLAVSTGMDPDPYTFWHSSQVKDPGLNLTSYATLGMDRALEQARRTLDQTQRKDLYGQVFMQLQEDAPAVYLYFADYVYAVDRSVRGLRIAPLADPSQRFWSVEDWYVRTVAQE
ncbi:MAG: peptide ABC transporter substrate-binding protein [Chloroflexi bacterium]|nr:MAG: peptide ABC transporter substrate-binding protein [Chloroflexota bacterium]